MLITRTSFISKKEHTFNLDVTPEQLFRINNTMELIQNIVPHLSPGDREFIKTGITQKEWDEMFNDVVI